MMSALANAPLAARSLALLTLLASTAAMPALAEGYGIVEARGLAMGGTTVALANTDTALFYNPALLSFHDGDEDLSRDGSVYFPIVNTQLAETVKDILAIEDDNLDGKLSTAIDAYNIDQSADNAQSVVNSGQDLLNAITPLDDEDVFGDGFIGLSLSEPGDREGAGFFLAGRVLGGGKADIADSDQALLADYIEALDFIASGGTRGAAHPELFNAGSLIDPVNALQSSASVKGAGIIEFGVSLSKEYSLWGVPVAFGITPKLMRVRTYEASQTVQGGDIVSSTSEKDFNSGNADVGVALQLAEHYRLGLAVKDVITQHYDTELGNELVIAAKPRLGLAYVSERFQLGMDVDLDSAEPVGNQAAIQELAIGGEWQASRHFQLRAGYRHDLKGERDDIASLGLGMNFGGVLIDIAYAEGGSSRGLALQLGFRR